MYNTSESQSTFNLNESLRNVFNSYVCRLCLNTDRHAYFINNTVLQETWERLADTAFDPNDGRPLFVCYMCCAQLRNSHELRKRALKAEELFTKFLSNNNFVDSKKLMSLIVSNTCNNDYNYAIEEQYNLDSGKKVPERVEEVKKEIEDDVKEEGGKIFFYLDKTVEEEDLVVDTISIKKEIEDVKEEINSESEMHDTVTETQADDEGRLRKRSFEVFAQSEIVLERIDAGVAAEKCKTEILHQTPERNVVDEGIMERKSLNNIFICQPKELSVTFDENISLNVHDTASNDRLNSYSRDKVFSCKLCKYECFTKMSYNIHLRKQHTGGDRACVSDLCDFGASDNDNINKQVMHEPKKEELFAYYKCPKHVSLRKKLNECLCENTEEKSHKCDFCDFKTIDTDNLKKHIIYQHRKKNNYTCHICEKQFVTRMGMNKHLVKHTGEKPPKIHLPVHSGDKPYKCDFCDFRTSDNKHLKIHLMLKHNKAKNYSCHTCQKNFGTKASLIRHLSVHTGEKPCKCDLCDYRATDSGSLKRHLMFKHTKEKNHTCHTCQKNFTTKNHLNKHLRVHTGEKPYKCDLCEFKTSEKQNLKIHLKFKHIKEKCYKCQMCKKNFVTKTDLNRHMRVHTGEKPYNCDLCDYRAADSGSLKKHCKFKHTKEKSYSCHICQKSFVNQSSVKTHLRVHTGEKPYKCDFCDYRTSHGGNLNKHVKCRH